MTAKAPKHVALQRGDMSTVMQGSRVIQAPTGTAGGQDWAGEGRKGGVWAATRQVESVSSSSVHPEMVIALEVRSQERKHLCSSLFSRPESY